MSRPVGLKFHPERHAVPSALQLQNLLAVLHAAADGVTIEPRQKVLLDAAEWLVSRRILSLETRHVEHADRRATYHVATLTDCGRSLLELLWP